MRSLSSTLIVAACCAVPALAAAQPYSPRTPVAFTGPTRTYAVSGCGDGRLSYMFNAPSVRLFCLDGTATVGIATTAQGTQFFQTVLDLNGTRLNDFRGVFYDIDYSNIQFDETLRHPGGTTNQVREGYGPSLGIDGHTTFGYSLLFPVGSTNSYEVLPDGITFGPTASVQLGYVPQDAPSPSANLYGRSLSFTLAVTAVPEPSTLVLTLGGAAMLASAARARRRS